MKFNLKNTPRGDLRVEFYNSLRTAGVNDTITLDFDDLGVTQNSYLYKGLVEDCTIYPKAIQNLHQRCPHLKCVKIY